MTDPHEPEPLRPMLKDAHAELAKHRDKACAHDDVDAASTAPPTADQSGAVREFRDARGILWRVWAVVPGQTRPDRPIEHRLGEYSDGWLAFKSEDGSQRCRLPHYPADWIRQSNQALEEMLERAEPVRVRRKNISDDADASP